MEKYPEKSQFPFLRKNKAEEKRGGNGKRMSIFAQDFFSKNKQCTKEEWDAGTEAEIITPAVHTGPAELVGL